KGHAYLVNKHDPSFIKNLIKKITVIIYFWSPTLFDTEPIKKYPQPLLHIAVRGTYVHSIL
ncbi:hypothetical protein CJ191_09080, partial [Aerococcus viridans]